MSLMSSTSTGFVASVVRPIVGNQGTGGAVSVRYCTPLVRRCAWVGAFALAAAGALRASAPHIRGRFLTMSASSTSEKALLGGGDGTVVRAPGGTPTAAIVFMHGLGDTCAGWMPIFPILPYVESVLPTADTRPVSLNMGMRMPAWFDLYGLDSSAREDSNGIASAVDRVNRIVRALPVPSERVVLAGFSQGGALALSAALQSEVPLAGVAALSSWLPLRDEYPAKLGPHAKDIPVFMAHGEEDQVVQTAFGVASAQILTGFGLNVETHTYKGMGHSACEKELEDFKNFLAKVLR